MWKKKGRRPSRNYDGTALTARHFRDVLPSILSGISKQQEERHDLVLASWERIVGEKISLFTHAESFSGGVLKVKVSNSTLFSILCRTEKPKLLARLRGEFPRVEFRDILFRMG